jgi:hypothetical protein
MADPVPHFMTKPLLIVGPSRRRSWSSVRDEQRCRVTDQDENDYETFCGTYSTYGPEKWTITATVLQSFGVDGVDEAAARRRHHSAGRAPRTRTTRRSTIRR